VWSDDCVGRILIARLSGLRNSDPQHQSGAG
jgi:hypothetical protein